MGDGVQEGPLRVVGSGKAALTGGGEGRGSRLGRLRGTPPGHRDAVGQG